MPDDVATTLLRDLFSFVEDGTLVRDISRDDEAGWAVRQLPLVRTLGRVQKFLENANG